MLHLSILVFISYFSIMYSVLSQSVNFFLLVISAFSIGRHLIYISHRRLKHFDAPPMSIIIPAYNEEGSIIASVRNIMRLKYNEFEVIVVNDGSNDDTLNVLKQEMLLQEIKPVFQKRLETEYVQGIYKSDVYPNLLVVEKDNGGKSDAINCGINVSQYPLFCVVDADSILDENSLHSMAYSFIDNTKETVAVGGVVCAANGFTIRDGRIENMKLTPNLWVRIQAVEYIRSFIVGRLAFNTLSSLMIISGAFGIFNKLAVIEIGGYDKSTVGEDSELVFRLQRHIKETGKRWSVDFLPDPVCYTLVPDKLSILGKQRVRWYIGLIQSMRTHIKMLFNPRYGMIGLFGAPYFLIIEALAPITEVIGLITTTYLCISGKIGVIYLVAMLLSAYAFNAAISMGAIVMGERSFNRYKSERTLRLLLVTSVAEVIVYKPIVATWLVYGITKYYINKARGGTKIAWGDMGKRSFGA